MEWLKSKCYCNTTGQCNYCNTVDDILDLTARLAEAQAEIERLKSYETCLDHWQLRFVVLMEAWKTGDNDAVLSAVRVFLQASHGDAALAVASRLAEAQVEIARLQRIHDSAWELETQWHNKADELAARLAEAEECIGYIARGTPDIKCGSCEVLVAARAFLANQDDKEADDDS